MNKQEMTIEELVTDALDSLYRAVGKSVLSDTPDEKFNRVIANAIEEIKNVPVPRITVGGEPE